MFVRLEKRDFVEILQQMRVSIEEIVFIHEEINNELQQTQYELVLMEFVSVRISSVFLARILSSSYPILNFHFLKHPRLEAVIFAIPFRILLVYGLAVK